MLFGGWDGLLRTLVVGVLAYVTLVVFLRISGKRTLAKMNAFDLIVTVALGSTLATVLLSKDVALAEGALAFALLIGLQFAVTWSSVRARWVRRLATGEPRMLLYCGEFLPAAMRQARVTEDEIRASVRSAGVDSLDEVRAVVLETDGSFSVVRPGKDGNGSSVLGVDVPREFREPAAR
ncbi:MAG: YetF domain-containing protein [Woeseia sp.]